MHILVMGASRGIGMATAKAALDRGHKVRAFSRSTSTIDHPMFSGMTGNALSPADVERALEGIDAVVQALGVGLGDLFRPVTLFSQASAILIDAMQRLGPQRLSAVTGFGAGDSQAAISPLQRLPFRLLFGRAYDDKSLQERLICDSDLAWTLWRPGVLTHWDISGRAKVLVRPETWRNGIVARADVAESIVSDLESGQFIHQKPVIVRF
ncbi:NAD(P)-binding oxidoreductase [Novosphingobium sp.]|uniref:NAD(P)-dependent oxidoreductase n=1 Tax=Novosphingobium sp. TaxID=1874826 RepID=UPI0031E23F8A